MDIEEAISLFLEALRKKDFAAATIETRSGALKSFLAYCQKYRALTIYDLKPAFLQKYMAFVHTKKRADNQEDLSISRKRTLLISLKLFVRFLYEKNYILNNYLEKIKIPAGRALPSSFLAESKIMRIIKAAGKDSPYPLRDRAILETFYSAGLRRKELASLQISDVDFLRQSLWVKAAKNKKERVVPVGASALNKIAAYLEKERPRLAKNIKGKDERFLFLSRKGNTISVVRLGELARYYRNMAGIKTQGACHIFRHAMASHMLKNGADIRYIQEMLGHSSVSTTQIYTKVEISTIQQEYERVFG